MSCVETETVVSSSGLSDDGTLRNRKNTRIDVSLPASHNTRPRRVCRRHSYAFRCSETDLYEDEEDNKHYESILLVRVCFLHIFGWFGWLGCLLTCV